MKVLHVVRLLLLLTAAAVRGAGSVGLLCGVSPLETAVRRLRPAVWRRRRAAAVSVAPAAAAVAADELVAGGLARE